MKNILISGGSRGLGLMFCRHQLKKGYKVFTFARKETLDMVQLKKEFYGKFDFDLYDLVNTNNISKLITNSTKFLGKIDILINNAAVGQDHLLAHCAKETIERIITINITSTILLTRQVLKHMIINRSGSIINVSSICSEKGFPGLTVYSATKGALNAFTRSLSREVGKANIMVNAVSPGFFSSEMSEILSDKQMKTIQNRTPTGYLCKPKDVVLACDTFIEEDLNITGQTLCVDGGMSIS